MAPENVVLLFRSRPPIPIMSLSVHQISPKPLPLESRNSHIVHVLHRQRSNSFQNQFVSPFLSILVKTIQRIDAGPKRKSSPPFVYGDSADSVGFRFVYTLVLPSDRSICIRLFSVLIRPSLRRPPTLTAN